MSILRKSKSLKIKIFSLILTLKEYYDMLDFKNPKVKFIYIDWYMFPFYPVNNFKNNGWKFDSKWESNFYREGLSLSAYAIFMFLVNSNFIYSLEEIRIGLDWARDNFEIDLNELIHEFKESSLRPINIKVTNVCFKHPNLQILSIKKTIDYYGFIERWRLKL